MARRKSLGSAGTVDLQALDRIQQRVLWLATRMVHEANHVRPNLDDDQGRRPPGLIASVVSILTALYLALASPGRPCLRQAACQPGVPRHAVPARALDRRYLTSLRAFGGLQAYPSRTKDPDPVDFSTGSVGLGAVAPLFAALADQLPGDPTSTKRGRRRTPLRRAVGDAELDEGNVWEAVARGFAAAAGQRAVDRRPEPAEPRSRHPRHQGRSSSKGSSQAAAGKCCEAKYGPRFRRLRRTGGAVLRRRIDEMSNEDYQELSGCLAPRRANGWSGAAGRVRDDSRRVVAAVRDEDLPPCWPTLADTTWTSCWRVHRPPMRTRTGHGALRLHDQGMGAALRRRPAEPLGAAVADQIARSRPASVSARTSDGLDSPLIRRRRGCASAARAPGRRRGSGRRRRAIGRRGVPASLRVGGRRLVPGGIRRGADRRCRDGAALGPRIVTAVPDVAVSTNLGGWVNRVGVFAPSDR